MADTPHAPDSPAPRRHKLVIAYDGALFHGWQKQEPPGQAPLRTVAGVVETTLVQVLRQPIKLVGASRTDTGVSALGQVAHFDAAHRVPIERLAQAINSRLPDDIDIRSAQRVHDTFDAISDAQSKQYRYRLLTTERRPLDRRFALYHCWTPLALDRMRDAAARLVGTHDFAGLASIHHNRETTIRTIFDCRVERASEAPNPFHAADPDEVHIVVSGSGFLYNMVRIIAGTLVEVGRGRLDPSIIEHILTSRNRRLAGPTLPPQGLWLEWIRHKPAPTPTQDSEA